MKDKIKTLSAGVAALTLVLLMIPFVLPYIIVEEIMKTKEERARGDSLLAPDKRWS